MSRVALVTGAAKGIGRAICERLSRAGYQVAGLDHDLRARGEMRDDLTIALIHADVADYDACATAVAEVERDIGPVDILVNNAGIVRDAMLHKMEPKAWRDVIEVDLTGLFNMTHNIVPGMRNRGFGRIVNISSVNALKGQAGQTNYAAAKAGVIGFTKALALETAGKGITVNAVAPGYIDTDLVAQIPAPVREQIIGAIPVRRLGRPDEVARCVEFLCADESGFITGETLCVNGGQYLR